MTSPIHYGKSGAIATIVLDRPAARNALTPEMLCRFADAIADVAADDAIRVLVVTGSGDAAFCAGADLRTTIPLLAGARAPEDDWDRRLLEDPRVLDSSTLRRPPLDKPVIAAVNGACHAAGAELLLGADVRLAAEHATFAWPEVSRGVLPFGGSMVRLPRQVAHGDAMRLLLTGEAIDAREALRIGLIQRVVPAAELTAAARAIAERIAGNAPIAVQHVKRTVREAAGRPLDDGFGLEDESRRVVLASDDAKEGPRAFLEKRPPVFRGR